MTTTDRRDAADAPAPSAAEQAVLDRIEWTPACEESAVERVARAIWESMPGSDEDISLLLRVLRAESESFVDVLLPLIEADRERAKAEGGAEALDELAGSRWIGEAEAGWIRDRAAALRVSTGGAR